MSAWRLWLAPTTATIVTVIIAIFGLMTPAFALGVSPIHIEMTSLGKGGRSQITVHNDSGVAMPVEIDIKKLTIGEQGQQKFSKASDEFLVFPPQAMLKPGATQIFRIQWVGEPDLAKSESYMLSVNQIPVQLPKTMSAIQLVMSFGVMVNVAPARGTPQLKLINTGVALDKTSGKHRPIITVENPGSVHALMQQASIKLSAGGWSRTLTNSEVAQKIGIGLVQPGTRRRFVVPVDLPAGVKDVKATIDFAPQR